ncbi:MAG: CHAD domain-containing protein [Legionellales bacterium]
MNQEKIKAIIKKKVNDITGLCRDINNSFDKDTIHNFRVSVKSLRSFLRLQRMYIHKPGLKMPKKFKRLYHIAGTIRETQLEIEHFEGRKPELPHYLNKLHQILALEKKEWGKFYSGKVLRRLDNKLAGFKYKKLHPDILERFFNDRMDAINTITNEKPPTDAQVHDARKKIKDMLYTSKLTGKKWKAAHKQIEDIPVKQLDNLANMMGDYNDERITLEHLNACSLRGMEKNEKNTMEHLRSKESKTLSVKKKNIIATAKKIIEPAKDK